MKNWVTKSGYSIIKILGGRSNVFLLQAEGYHILIDSGPAFMWRLLDARLKKLGIKKVDYLILTHAHFDHAANAHNLKKKYHAKIIVHAEEAQNLATGTNPIIAGTSFFSKSVALMGAKAINFLKYTPCSADFLIDSTFDFNIIDVHAQILHTPGHTIGSQSLIVDDEIALVGDCMFGVFKNSAFPPFVSNVNLLMESWKHLLKHPCSIFLPSHGGLRTRNQVINTRNKILTNLIHT